MPINYGLLVLNVEIYDHVHYLSSLGRAQTAVVKRDANVGVAESERDAGIQVRGWLRTVT